MGDGFLAEYSLLLALAGYGCLEGAKDLVGLGDWELGDGNVGAGGVFDRDGGSVFTVAKEGSAGVCKIKSHVLIGTFQDF